MIALRWLLADGNAFAFWRLMPRQSGRAFSTAAFGPRGYTRDHEWLAMQSEVEGGDEAGGGGGVVCASLGITDVAARALGDVVYVELPRVGTSIAANDVLGIVESVKGASDIFSPVSGVVTEVNGALAKTPSLVNKDPFGRGWLVKLRLQTPVALDHLMNDAQYHDYCRTKTP